VLSPMRDASTPPLSVPKTSSTSCDLGILMNDASSRPPGPTAPVRRPSGVQRLPDSSGRGEGVQVEHAGRVGQARPAGP
jgi:hypothetical protein